MIYVASPYSSPSSDLRHARYLAVRQVIAKHISSQPEALFSPILYTHELANEHDFHYDAKTWIRFNTDMLRKATQLWVVMLPGWVSSIGVTAEIALAKQLLIPITYFSEDGTIQNY